MRQETTETTIKLIEFDDVLRHWYVRWDFKLKSDSENTYWYEEEVYNWIPTIEDIQKTIIDWFNKQTDGYIKIGFNWKGIDVYLNDENKFNYKAITDEAARREALIVKWDQENPELAGKNYIETTNLDGEMLPVPTGRPSSMFPITLKLGTMNTPENFYQFETLDELQEFFSAGVDHLISAYGTGWYKIANFDWTPYVEALQKL